MAKRWSGIVNRWGAVSMNYEQRLVSLTRPTDHSLGKPIYLVPYAPRDIP
jgi:hypothetical protein